MLRCMSMHAAAAVAAEVFSALTTDSGSFQATAVDALHLPQDLLAAWLATAGPVLDLREVALTPVQWTCLAACFGQQALQTANMHTLHLREVASDDGTSVLDSRELTEFEHRLQRWRLRKVNHVCLATRSFWKALFGEDCILNQLAVGHNCPEPGCRGFCAVSYTHLTLPTKA